jgi:hypothetical protein
MEEFRQEVICSLERFWDFKKGKLPYRIMGIMFGIEIYTNYNQIRINYSNQYTNQPKNNE